MANQLPINQNNENNGGGWKFKGNISRLWSASRYCARSDNVLMPYNCVNSSVRLFADDCLLYRTIKKKEDHLTLQADLKHLEEWANKWGMRFNTKKCYVLSINNKSSRYYQLEKHTLQEEQDNPYLIALFCIRSSLSMSPLRYGFQMVAPYSMIDLTRVTYVVFRHVSGTFLKFLLHFRSFEIWSPKYGLSCTSCSVCFSTW
jgi:hypothetical protein